MAGVITVALACPVHVEDYTDGKGRVGYVLTWQLVRLWRASGVEVPFTVAEDAAKDWHEVTTNGRIRQEPLCHQRIGIEDEDVTIPIAMCIGEASVGSWEEYTELREELFKKWQFVTQRVSEAATGC